MRESSGAEQRNGVIFVLDSKPECRVVFDALSDHRYIGNNPNYNYDHRNQISFVYRFRNQTRIDREIMISTERGIGTPIFEGWNDNPTFEIKDEDIAFVFIAAKRVLQQKDMANRLFNRLTRRTNAVKHISTILCHYIPNTSPLNQKSKI
jgi:hypothetical protein